MSDTTSWFPLPAEVGIYTAAELRTHWLAQLAGLPPGGSAVELDGSAVEQFDAAGAQLLLALSHALKARGGALQVAQPSQALVDGCRVLGLSDLLEVQ